MMAIYDSPYSLDQHLRSIRQLDSPAVFTRDFAYANNAPSILHESIDMAKGDIIDLSASAFAELLSGPTVDIYVGPKRKHWSLHQNLLCHYSSYFETEFQGHEVPKDREATKLELPNDDPRGFSLLVKWLYQGRLDIVTNVSEEQMYEHAVACHKLHQLCDRFSMFALKNLAIDSYRSNLHAAQLVPDAQEINEIYRSSAPNSAFRKLMAKIAARQIMDPGAERDTESYRCCFEDNADFAVDMMNAVRQLSGGMLFEDPTKGDDCAWHDHRDGSACIEKGVERVQFSDEGKGLSKITSPTARRNQPPSATMENPAAERPSRQPEEDSQLLPARSMTPPNVKTLQPVAFSPGGSIRPTNPTARSVEASSIKSKPRKLEQTPVKPALVNGIANNSPSVANESRKLTPSRKVQFQVHVDKNDVQAKSGRVTNGVARTSSPPISSAPRARQPARSSIHVNGIVRQFNGLDSAVSESSAGDSVARRQPPKLKRKVGG